MNLILGTMKAGKSATLLKYAKKYYDELSKDNLIIIRPTCDTRDFFTREKIDYTKQFNYGNKTTDLKEFQYIFIDEIHFFSKEYVKNLTQLKYIKLFIAGLNGDTKRRVWENVAFLLPFASSIEYLNADCDICGKKQSAIFHIGNGEINDNYQVCCQACYEKEKI